MKTSIRERARRGAFTLIELLVVIVIVSLLSAVALPTIVTALNEREILEASSLLQASLSAARDTAARTGRPTGVRLLLDPDVSTNGALAANRMITITQAPEHNAGSIFARQVTWVRDPNGTPVPYQFLIAYEEKFRFVPDPMQPNPLDINQYQPISTYQSTSWYWNVRQGESLRVASSRPFTIAGPMVTASRTANPERYLNLDPTSGNTRIISLPRPPGAYPSGLAPPTINVAGVASGPQVPMNPNFLPIAYITATGSEYLILMDGRDNDGDGYVDEAFDGIDNDGDGVTDPAFDGIDNDGVNGIDDLGELVFGYVPGVPGSGEYEPEELERGGSQRLASAAGLSYVITRRPVVAENARETVLPGNIVIDLTMLDADRVVVGNTPQRRRPERSRLPMDHTNGTVDVLFAPNGQVLEEGLGVNVREDFRNLTFYHFWLASRTEVYPPSPPGSIRGQSPYPYLPTPNVGTNNGPPLQEERRLITLTPKTGNIVINSLEDFEQAPYTSATPADVPYRAAQSGTREP